MDPLTQALIGAGINVGSGLLANIPAWLNAGEIDSEEEALRRLIMADPEQLGTSALEVVREDPRYLASEQQALDRLMGLGTGGGLDAQAQARLTQAQMQAAQQERSARGGILSREAQRGPISSGRALSAQLQAGSDAADRMALVGTQAAADAEARALAALTGGAGLAGRMQERGTGLALRRAGAADDRKRFNLGLREDARRRQMGYHQGRAQQLRGQAQDMGDKISNFGGAVAGGFSSYGQMMADEERRKRAQGGGSYSLPYDTGRNY